MKLAGGGELHLRETILAQRAGIIRNTYWNLAGLGLPLAAAAWAMPRVVAALGTERFGLLALIWVIVGYAGLLDFGVGRALTVLVSESLANNRASEVPSRVVTAMALLTAFGCASAVLLLVSAHRIATSFLNVSQSLRGEAESAIYVLAAAIPFVLCSAGLVGILEATQRFDLINLVRTPLGLVNYLSPLALASFTHRLDNFVWALALARVAAFTIYCVLCVRVLPARVRSISWAQGSCRRLLQFGGWLTLTNVLSQTISCVDRVLLSSLSSATAVAYYAVPSEVTTRLLILPSALVNALFPTLASSYSNTNARNGPKDVALFVESERATFLFMWPVLFLVVVFAREGLAFWLTEQFAATSARALQWLGVGALLNSIGRVAFTAIQAAGRADVTGKIYIAESIPFVVLFSCLTASFGVTGAASAVGLRMAIDSALLLVASHRLGLLPGRDLRNVLTWAAIASLTCLAGASMRSIPVRLFLLGATLLTVAWQARSLRGTRLAGLEHRQYNPNPNSCVATLCSSRNDSVPVCE